MKSWANETSHRKQKISINYCLPSLLRHYMIRYLGSLTSRNCSSDLWKFKKLIPMQYTSYFHERKGLNSIKKIFFVTRNYQKKRGCFPLELDSRLA